MKGFVKLRLSGNETQTLDLRYAWRLLCCSFLGHRRGPNLGPQLQFLSEDFSPSLSMKNSRCNKTFPAI